MRTARARVANDYSANFQVTALIFGMDTFIGVFSNVLFLFLKKMKSCCFMGVQKYIVPKKLPILGDCARARVANDYSANFQVTA